jgi:hypothetical protein
MAIILTAVAAAAALVQPSATKTFSDWIVGCDNVRVCMAVSLEPENGDAIEGQEPVTLIVQRDAGRNDPVLLSFGGGEVGTARSLTSDGGAQILGLNGDSAVAVDKVAFATLRNGRRAELRNAAGKTIASASLKGLSAAMRYMDDVQKRVGGTTAMVATGPAAASLVPPAPPLPVVTAAKLSALRPVRPTAPQIKAMQKATGCDADDAAFDEDMIARIDAKTTLFLLPCGAGAYNVNTVPMVSVGTGAALRFVAAKFDSDMTDGQPGSTMPMLTNAGWDDKHGTLNDYHKARGIGDCGTSTTHVWDGSRFRLIEQRTMGECRGSMDWITTWRADAR